MRDSRACRHCHVSRALAGCPLTRVPPAVSRGYASFVCDMLVARRVLADVQLADQGSSAVSPSSRPPMVEMLSKARKRGYRFVASVSEVNESERTVSLHYLYVQDAKSGPAEEGMSTSLRVVREVLPHPRFSWRRTYLRHVHHPGAGLPVRQAARHLAVLLHGEVAVAAAETSAGESRHNGGDGDRTTGLWWPFRIPPCCALTSHACVLTPLPNAHASGGSAGSHGGWTGAASKGHAPPGSVLNLDERRAARGIPPVPAHAELEPRHLQGRRGLEPADHATRAAPNASGATRTGASSRPGQFYGAPQAATRPSHTHNGHQSITASHGERTGSTGPGHAQAYGRAHVDSDQYHRAHPHGGGVHMDYGRGHPGAGHRYHARG